MSRLTSGRHGALAHLMGNDWGRRRTLARHGESSGVSRGLLIAGLVAVGVGALACYVLAPDVQRYIKLRNM